MFPFARGIVADVTRDGGFPPVLLAPIDFLGLYAQRKQQPVHKVTISNVPKQVLDHMAARGRSKYLLIHHMADPSDRMPVGRIHIGKGPHYPLPCQATKDPGISREVERIIKRNGPVTRDLKVDDKNGKPEKAQREHLLHHGTNGFFDSRDGPSAHGVAGR